MNESFARWHTPDRTRFGRDLHRVLLTGSCTYGRRKAGTEIADVVRYEMGLSGERRGCPNGPGFGCSAGFRRSMTAGVARIERQDGRVSSFMRGLFDKGRAAFYKFRNTVTTQNTLLR